MLICWAPAKTIWDVHLPWHSISIYRERQQYRRFYVPFREEVKAEIDKLLSKVIIEPAASPWASPFVSIRKKNGTMHLCVDFRSVNSLTKPDSFPLPNLTDTVSQLGGNSYFTSLDLMTGEQLYRYTRLPFGVTNGPACFTRLMSVSGPLWMFPWIKRWSIRWHWLQDEHLKNSWKIYVQYCRFREHKLKLNIEKCAFFKTGAEYLGHEVSREGISPIKKNLDAIIDFPRSIGRS